MVASRLPRSAFSTLDPLAIDGDSRKVCPYPGNQPALIRTWREHLYAFLDSKNILDALTLPEIDQDAVSPSESATPRVGVSLSSS